MVTEFSSQRLRSISVYIHLSFGLDAELYYKEYIAGLQPDESPYGFHLARKAGFQSVVFSHDGSDGVLIRLVRRLLRRALNFDLMHAVQNRKSISAADVIWVMTEKEAFSIAMARRLGLVKKRPMIANMVWIFNEWDQLTKPRQTLLRLLSKDISLTTVHSRASLATANRAFPHLKQKLMFFGINGRLFKKNSEYGRDKPETLKIFSAGNDKTRDWDTLLEAFGNDRRFELTILCSRLPTSVESDFSNVKVIRERKVEVLLACYRQTDLVVITMLPNTFSGVTVALEAAAMGKALICSRTGGVPTYFSDDDVEFIQPCNAALLRSAALASSHETRTSRSQSAFVKFNLSEYHTDGLVKRYIEETCVVLDP